MSLFSLFRKTPKTQNPIPDNGYYGFRAAMTAESYLYARLVSGQEFNYKTDNFLTNRTLPGHSAPFAVDAYRAEIPSPAVTPKDFPGYDPKKTYGYRLFDRATRPKEKLDGTYPNHIAPCMDCSSFVLLALLGIDWEHSPWMHYGTNVTWNARNIALLAKNASDGKNWQQLSLILQPQGKYRDIGIPRYSCVRTAADIAEVLLGSAGIVYDRPITSPETRKQNIPTAEEIHSIVQPGDIVFWSNLQRKENGKWGMRQPDRFRCISHIAMVASDPQYTVEVTSGSKLPHALYYRKLDNLYDMDGHAEQLRLDGITLILRPDYCRGNAPEEIPVGENLLRYPWAFSQEKVSNIEGLTCTVTGKSEILLVGSTDELTLKENLRLTTGTYQLSGCNDLTAIVRSGSKILASGNPDFRFSISEPTTVCVSLNVPKFSGTISPKLIKL